MDDVEEGREAVDVVELARERRGEVEAEPVDAALEHEVAQRVHDQPQHRRMGRVERVARPGEVHVEAAVVGDEPVVARVVDALEREHRAEVVALGGVVVDDVEDHLDPGAVERLHHPLELAHLLAARAGRRVEGVRREEADRGVAPVVRQAPLGEELLVGDVVHREQLDGGDAEVAEVRDRGLRGEPRVRAAEVLAHAGHQLREALHVHLVDHRLVPRRRRRRGRPPSRTRRRRRRTSGSRRRRPRRPGPGRPPRPRSAGTAAGCRAPSGSGPRSPSRTGR